MANKNQLLIEHLSQFISEERWKKFNEVIKFRTRHITIALEDIYQAHNASAVLRSCDIFGIQDIHIIENKNSYTVSEDVALGSQKWLNLIKYRKTDQNNTITCIKELKSMGYKIIATTPHAEKTIEEINIKNPIAIFFGTELTGISEDVKNNADELVKIPMFGFTESFNISVSAALTIHTLTTKMHKENVNWCIEENLKEEILLNWLRNSIKKVELIEANFLKNNS